jgi:hypothetical protein
MGDGIEQLDIETRGPPVLIEEVEWRVRVVSAEDNACASVLGRWRFCCIDRASRSREQCDQGERTPE